jgi:putative endonuclease
MQFLHAVSQMARRSQSGPRHALGASCAGPRAVWPQPNTVYIIESLSSPEQYYIGATANLPKRLAAHNAGESRHTSKYRPWRLLVFVRFTQCERAIRFERYLKSHSGRAFIARHLR